MQIKKYGDTPLSIAELPKEKDVMPEAESGLNICLHKLKKSRAPHNKVLFGNITASDLKKTLESARNFVDAAKFELGEDF
jgi:ACT domain-containing protein